jgi:hypothetical protein
VDFLFPALQGIALAGMFIGLLWIFRDCAVHRVEDLPLTDDRQRRFMPPDPRDTLIVVIPPTEAEAALSDRDESAPPILTDPIIARTAPHADRGVVTTLQ